MNEWVSCRLDDLLTAIVCSPEDPDHLNDETLELCRRLVAEMDTEEHAVRAAEGSDLEPLRTMVPLICEIWRSYYRRVNRPKGQLRATGIAAAICGLAEEEVIQNRLSRERLAALRPPRKSPRRRA